MRLNMVLLDHTMNWADSTPWDSIFQLARRLRSRPAIKLVLRVTLAVCKCCPSEGQGTIINMKEHSTTLK
ncbi:hypothetical protein Y1Q_0019758 [Alligator mississippiensis]|uniref:Uncharacterized protein n=1 Tax=Alligator mississippiensis TaxID=8496 RepID=A0A151PF11_ALLMI|nr:hypothetical protein Y1Q_0019758 [Alligator mississippiensis]